MFIDACEELGRKAGSILVVGLHGTQRRGSTACGDTGTGAEVLVVARSAVDTWDDRNHAPTRKRHHTMLATTYPLLSIFWTMIEFFFFLLWIWLAIMVFSDIFRSHDLGGGSKALWAIFIVLLPYLGVFAYLVFRGGGMHERSATQAALQHRAFQGYFPHMDTGSTNADQLHKLADLKEKGFISEDEFQAEKAKILA
jgi:hypothetical protein